MVSLRLLATALLAAITPAHAQVASAPPAIDLVIRPAGPVLDVRMTIDGPAFDTGDPLVRLPLKLVGIPSARYDGDTLTARDDHGALALVQSEEPPTPQGVYRRWSTTRATVGRVQIRFAAPPRAVDAATNNGPLFDLRAENGGFIGAGVGFMPAPVRPGPYRVTLHWDIPSGWRGVWSLGAGDVTKVIPAELLQFSFYAVGPLKSEPAQPDDRFGMYWLTDPPFDAKALGDRIQRLYRTIADFFAETGGSYRVFLRQNPYRGQGGTALAQSFTTGYFAADKPTLDGMQAHIAHEMVHNWPAMQGEHGDTAWYSEGTAEFYSLLLSYRAGMLSPAQFRDAINKKAYDYYTNPYRTLSNKDVAKLFWNDPTAQTVPYGRGFLYLLRTDSAIRAASHGAKSVDDVVKQMRRRQTSGQPYGLNQWLDLVGAQIGPDAARRDYEAMASGMLLVAPGDRFDPCLTTEQHDEAVFELGFARSSLAERRVSGLLPGSAAARAGVRDGDAIVDAGNLATIRSNPSLPMTLTLRRDGQTITLSYLPRGAAVTAWRWRETPGAARQRCAF